MEKNKSISLNFNLNLSEIQDDFQTFISDKCYSHLVNNVYEGYLIKKILKHSIYKDKKININGTISVKIVCICKIIDPIIDSIIKIKINDVNKMGYSYKEEKLCIFMPIHLCQDIYNIGDTIEIKIIGKRIEENIVCIGQPI